MKKTIIIKPNSPFKTTLISLNNYRKFLIIHSLLEGKKRFGVLLKTSGFKTTNHAMIADLRELIESGLVKRKVYAAQVPIKVEYSLTEIGYSLKPIIEVMTQWGETYLKKRGKVPSV